MFVAEPNRRIIAGEVYHVINLGNGRMTLLHKPADFDAFVRVLRQGFERYRVRVTVGDSNKSAS